MPISASRPPKRSSKARSNSEVKLRASDGAGHAAAERWSYLSAVFEAVLMSDSPGIASATTKSADRMRSRSGCVGGADGGTGGRASASIASEAEIDERIVGAG